MIVDKVKNIELRDDGFLEVTLKRIKDFDDYIYQQIQSDGYCLPCVRDYRQKSKLYYDTKGYISMHDYLCNHVFEAEELQLFLIFVLEALVQINVSKPIYLSLSYIYLHHDGNHIRFLVIPISLEHWLFQKDSVHKVLLELLEMIQSNHGFETIGYLHMMSKAEDITFPVILQGLHALHDQHKKKPTLLERILHLEKHEDYKIRELPQPTPYPQQRMSMQIHEESKPYQTPPQDKDLMKKTMVLFQENECFFEQVEGKKRFYVQQQVFTIGRSPDNEMSLNEASISSYHACFRKEQNELEDLHSSNGTYVNKKKIQKQVLKHGDQIHFANVVFTFYQHEDG